MLLLVSLIPRFCATVNVERLSMHIVQAHNYIPYIIHSILFPIVGKRDREDREDREEDRSVHLQLFLLLALRKIT